MPAIVVDVVEEVDVELVVGPGKVSGEGVNDGSNWVGGGASTGVDVLVFFVWWWAVVGGLVAGGAVLRGAVGGVVAGGAVTGVVAGGAVTGVVSGTVGSGCGFEAAEAERGPERANTPKPIKNAAPTTSSTAFRTATVWSKPTGHEVTGGRRSTSPGKMRSGSGTRDRFSSMSCRQ